MPRCPTHIIRSITTVIELTSRLKSIEFKLDSIKESLPSTANEAHRSPSSEPLETGELPNPVSKLDGNGQQHSVLCTPAEKSQTHIRMRYSDSGLAIPESHTTAPQNMLEWPCSPVRLSRMEINYPIALEIERDRLPLSENYNNGIAPEWLDRLSVAQLRELSSYYFSYFHPHTLILNKDDFYALHLSRAMQCAFNPSIDSCLVLLVLALGAVAAAANNRTNLEDTHSPSQPSACDVLPMESVDLFNTAAAYFHCEERVDWISVTCLLLMRWI